MSSTAQITVSGLRVILETQRYYVGTIAGGCVAGLMLCVTLVFAVILHRARSQLWLLQRSRGEAVPPLSGTAVASQLHPPCRPLPPVSHSQAAAILSLPPRLDETFKSDPLALPRFLMTATPEVRRRWYYARALTSDENDAK